jgi:hypothetical protein
MAMEMHVLFRGPLPSKAALGRTIKELGFPLTITAKGSLDRQSGFMPMRLQREETGVEFDTFDGRDTVEELAGKEVDPSFDRVASFRWGGAEDEMLCAMCAAAALAKLTGGLVLEEVSGELMAADVSIRSAKEHLERTPMPRMKKRGTRPGDFKRYLKPLLQTRSDLVLIGRTLLVRPIRHVLRGVLFEPSSISKGSFYVWRYMAPLYDPRRGDPSDRIYDDLWDAWQPHIEPLLIDVLATDIFSEFGSVTDLNRFASESATLRHLDRAIPAYLLAGQREHAEDLVREIEERGERGTKWVEDQRAFLSGDLAATCELFHARETAAAQAWELGENWDPSPFPAELPIADRHRCADPLFPVLPWPDRPEWLLADAPSSPGDLRFAKDRLFRKGEVTLLVPLDRKEAGIRHTDYEPYVLAGRMPDGLLAVLRFGGDDRLDPNRAGDRRPDRRHLHVDLYGPKLRAAVYQYQGADGLVVISSASVWERVTQREIWHASAHDGRLTVWDSRKPSDNCRSERDRDATELGLVEGPAPEFGAHPGVVERALARLRATGCDDLL